MLQSNQYQVGDFVELKKRHPSQTRRWEIVRLGIDIRLKSTFKHHLYLEIPRPQFRQIVKKVISST